METDQTDTPWLQPAAATSRIDRQASLDALHILEDALGSPSPGREPEWLSQVITTIDALLGALDAQAANDRETVSILSEIAVEEPRLQPRVERLRREHDDMVDALRSLREQITPAVNLPVDAADIRERMASIGRRLRQHRAREADLVYEAVNIDLGVGD